MRKDKLSSYQAKKEKLLKIKSYLNEANFLQEKKALNPVEILHKIWEIVKDE